MTTLREAAEIGFNYINHALVLLDQAYGDHPSMQKERQLIVDDLEAVQKALNERQECETCAAKRKKLTEAGLLKSPLRDVDMGIDRGAWADVPDATKWVDELRGDDELEEPPNSKQGKATDIHSCSYYCDNPPCIKRQRDEMRENLFKDFESDAYGDGNTYRGVRSKDSAVKTVWVGLTDVEIRHIEQMNSRSYMEHARAIEAKLREKNL
jgi:hypothetical protein